MPSKLTVVGLIVLILGSVFLVLFTFILPQVNIGVPIISGSSSQSDERDINSGDTERIAVANVRGHPLWVYIRVTFILQGSNEYDCDVKLLYESDNLGSIDIAEKNYNLIPNKNYIQRSITVTLMPPASSTTYDLYLEITNNGDDIVLGQRVILVTYSLFSTIIPAIIALVGLILIIVGIVTGRGPSVVKAKAAPGGGWEPTLQWGGGSGTGAPATKKQPKMVIKSTKGSKKVKKVVKKAAPAGGGQSACKFCGKQVAASAFFCPHCYGKLR